MLINEIAHRTRPVLYMLIGVPGSGKSTWVRRNRSAMNRPVILSTDAYIERQMRDYRLPYSRMFRRHIQDATQAMQAELRSAVESGRDIIWDQTNLDSASRRRKLNQVPSEYEKVAVVFKTPGRKLLNKRLNSRTVRSSNQAGALYLPKDIPTQVIDQMIADFEPPSGSEGFDRITQA